MKTLRLLMATMILGFAVSANAMSYEQARERALFLTDKMAYELQLDDRQYEAAYEINLDYLLSLNRKADIYSSYWRSRNRNLQYIFSELQYRRFAGVGYFYRPVYWTNNSWYLPVYRHYTDRSRFYRGRPRVYATYRGGLHRGNHKYYKDLAHSWKKYQKEVRKERREIERDYRHHSYDKHRRDMQKHADRKYWEKNRKKHSFGTIGRSL